MPTRGDATSPPILGDPERNGGWLKSMFDYGGVGSGVATALQTEGGTNLQLEDGVTTLEYAAAA